MPNFSASMGNDGHYKILTEQAQLYWIKPKQIALEVGVRHQYYFCKDKNNGHITKKIPEEENPLRGLNEPVAAHPAK